MKCVQIVSHRFSQLSALELRRFSSVHSLWQAAISAPDEPQPASDQRTLSPVCNTYGDVESGDSKLVLTSVVEDLVNVLSGDDTGGNNVKNTHSIGK